MIQQILRLYQRTRPVGCTSQKPSFIALLLVGLFAAAAPIGLAAKTAAPLAAPALEHWAMPGNDTIAATICGESVYIFNDQTLKTSGLYLDTLVASDGTDSILALKLTVLPLNVTPVSGAICAGGLYDFYGETLTVAGHYDHHFTAENGCDSIILLTLSVLPVHKTTLTAAQCDGTSYVFQNDTLTVGGNYSAVLTAANGCDSTVDLHLSFVPYFVTDLFQTICLGDTAFYAGDTLTVSGSYADSLTAVGGCDSTVVLHLKVLDLQAPVRHISICSGSGYFFNNENLTLPGTYLDTMTAVVSGCDSLITLVLDTVPFFETNLSATICSGDTFDFNGVLLTDTGLYSDTLTAVGGCDSTILLNLVVLPNSQSALSATICSDETYAFNGQGLNQSGIFEMTVASANGCDSTITLTLDVLPPIETTVAASICANETYSFNGQDYGAEGTYFAHLTAENGCDSTVTLVLTVLPLKASSEQATICSGETYLFNGVQYAQSGTYTATLTAANGCDSTATLSLTVLPLMPTVQDMTICPGGVFVFHGQVLSASGTYTEPITGANGCPTTATLHLTVLPTNSSNNFATICANQVYIFNNQVLSLAGNYTAVVAGSNGCDSIVNLELFVLPTASSSFNATICANETYQFNNQSLNQPGNYSATYAAENGCDSVVTLHLTVLPVKTTVLSAAICPGAFYQFGNQNLTAAGNYVRHLTAANGCDSTVTLALSILPTSHVILAAQVCTGSTYHFEGQNLTATGTYTANHLGANGCDSTIELHLFVGTPLNSGYNVAVCTGETYDFNGTVLAQTGIYKDTLTASGGCDSIVTVSFTVLPKFAVSVAETICAGSSYLFDGQNLTASGTYSGLFTAVNGCDSVVMLDLTVLPKSFATVQATICSGEGYLFNGILYENTGIYTATHPAANGCDSITTLDLNVLPSPQTGLTAAICAGETYQFEGQNLTASGIYQAIYPAENGCDSTVVLTLTVHPAYQSQTSETICASQSYDFYGQNLTASGTYHADFSSVNGCDSTIVLHLTVAPAIAAQINTSICAGQSYDFYGQNLTAVGSYQVVFTAANGCDSTINLNLTIHQPSQSVQNASICGGGSYNFNGQNLTASGTYQSVLTNANGCDSTAILNLTVFPETASNIQATICDGDSYQFNLQSLTTSGTYITTLANGNSHGCDSTVTLQLTVLQPISSNHTVNLCQGETVVINGQPFSTPGIYTEVLQAANGCDSTVHITVIVDQTAVSIALTGSVLTATATPGSFIQWANCDTQLPIPGANASTYAPTTTGNYAAVALSPLGCIVVSSCVFVQVIATEEPVQDLDWKLYPNPTLGMVKIEIAHPATADLTVGLFDVHGRLVSQKQFGDLTNNQLDLTGLPLGVYMVRITDGKNNWVKQLIKVE